MSGDPIQDKIVQPAADRAAAERPRHLRVLVALFVASVAAVAFVLVSQHSKISGLSEKADHNAEVSQQLFDQLRALGATPVVQPPAEDGRPTAAPDPTVIRNAARAAVIEYCAGPGEPCRGVDGASPNIDLIVNTVVTRIPIPKDGTDGEDAPAVTGTQLFAQVAAFCAQPSEPCRGPAGTDAQTPPCMSESTQCRGEDGQPPSSWTTTYDDGSVQTCTRSESFDPQAPTYTCTVSSGEPSTTEPAETPPGRN